jgi:hypothetical protein
LLPDSIFIWVTYILVGAGLALYIASKLVNLIPLMGQYKLPAELIGVALLVAGSYFMGGHGVQSAWEARVKELQDKLAAAEVESQKVNTVIETKVVEKIKYIDRKVEVVRTQIEKDKEIINADCKVNETAIKDYNAAIADPDDAKKDSK